MLQSMSRWLSQRKSRSDGADHGYTSFSDDDLSRGFTTSEDAMLDRIQRGEHNTSETFDDLHQRLVWVATFVVIVIVVVVVVVVMR